MISLIHILVDYIDDPGDHVLFPAVVVPQVGLGCQLVQFGAAPHFDLPTVADVKHILKHIEIPKLVEEDLEALEGHGIYVQTVVERDVVDDRQGGDGRVQVDIALEVLPAPLDAMLLAGQVAGGRQVHVHMPHFKDVVYAAELLLRVHYHSVLQQLHVRGRLVFPYRQRPIYAFFQAVLVGRQFVQSVRFRN